MNAKLRLNSMWALKNIIAGASNFTKRTCLEELGPGWLKQIVAHDVEDSSFQSFLVNSRRGDRDDETSTLMRIAWNQAAGQPRRNRKCIKLSLITMCLPISVHICWPYPLEKEDLTSFSYFVLLPRTISTLHSLMNQKQLKTRTI